MRILAFDHFQRIHVDGIQFEHNGVTLSLGMGEHHYCEARTGNYPPKNVEVAVWRDKQNMEKIGSDSVIGWIDLENLPKLLRLLLCDNAEKEIAEFLSTL